ncbi:MAG: NAD(P)/FAD-dependent oxidoreductase [Hominenteromicrobium sp.]
MKQAEVVILGGGAAGLMASCAAARILKRNGSVLLLEGNPKLGRKLLATGNGRCNLTNLNVSPGHYHGDAAAAVPLLEKYTPEAVIAAFRDMGLITKADDEGRVYPRSLQAAAVLAVLRRSAEESGVTCMLGSPASSVRKAGRGFRVQCADSGEIEAARCILACGGAASPKHSCSADGYAFAKALGHTVTPLYPALTQLLCRGKVFKSLAGMRCAARAALLADGKEICAESGEVLFTETGLSGICVFGLSVYAGEFFALGTVGGKAHRALSVSLDCLPDWSFTELCDYILEMRTAYPNRMAGELLDGLLNMRVGSALVQAAGIDPARSAKFVAPGQMQKLAALTKAWRFEVTGTKSWQDAQITAGGIPLKELDPLTMRSKKTDGLYLAGEMLNVHGDCGGYNLHFAWATGLAAGEAAAKSILKEKRS